MAVHSELRSVLCSPLCCKLKSNFHFRPRHDRWAGIPAGAALRLQLFKLFSSGNLWPCNKI